MSSCRGATSALLAISLVACGASGNDEGTESAAQQAAPTDAVELRLVDPATLGSAKLADLGSLGTFGGEGIAAASFGAAVAPAAVSPQMAQAAVLVPLVLFVGLNYALVATRVQNPATAGAPSELTIDGKPLSVYGAETIRKAIRAGLPHVALFPEGVKIRGQLGQLLGVDSLADAREDTDSCAGAVSADPVGATASAGGIDLRYRIHVCRSRKPMQLRLSPQGSQARPTEIAGYAGGHTAVEFVLHDAEDPTPPHVTIQNVPILKTRVREMPPVVPAFRAFTFDLTQPGAKEDIDVFVETTSLAADAYVSTTLRVTTLVPRGS